MLRVPIKSKKTFSISKMKLKRLKQKSILLLSNIWHKDWTNSLGWTKVVVGSLGVAFHQLGQILNNADVKAAVDTLHLDPKVMLGLAVLGVLTLMSGEHA